LSNVTFAKRCPNTQGPCQQRIKPRKEMVKKASTEKCEGRKHNTRSLSGLKSPQQGKKIFNRFARTALLQNAQTYNECSDHRITFRKEKKNVKHVNRLRNAQNYTILSASEFPPPPLLCKGKNVKYVTICESTKNTAPPPRTISINILSRREKYQARYWSENAGPPPQKTHETLAALRSSP